VRPPGSVAQSKRGGSSRSKWEIWWSRGAPNDKAAAALVSPLRDGSRSHIAEYLRVRQCSDGGVPRRYGGAEIVVRHELSPRLDWYSV
jgi:hypothetical protein